MRQLEGSFILFSIPAETLAYSGCLWEGGAMRRARASHLGHWGGGGQDWNGHIGTADTRLRHVKISWHKVVLEPWSLEYTLAEGVQHMRC